MTKTHQKVSETDLHAYVDGRLESERAAQVADYLDEHIEERARVGAYGRLNELLQQGYSARLAEKVPERLSRIPTGVFWPRRVAAAAAWLAVGTALGWSLGATRTASLEIGDGLVQSASRAHQVYVVEVRHPVEVSAKEEAHLSAWLSKRLGATLHPPNLGTVGYDLVGGRLLPGVVGGPAAQFMYEDAGGHRLTLYISKADTSSGDTAFRYHDNGDLSVFYWVDGDFGYALSGQLPREQLLRAARVSYQALNP